VTASIGDDLIDRAEEWIVIGQPSPDVGQVHPALRFVGRHQPRHWPPTTCDENRDAAECDAADQLRETPLRFGHVHGRRFGPAHCPPALIREYTRVYSCTTGLGAGRVSPA